MKTFYYDSELLAKFEAVNSPYVFALDMGLGKTQTLYEYLQRHPTNNSLIIVNNIKQLTEMAEVLPDVVAIWHSKLEDIEFKNIMCRNIIAITKNKFFQLILHEEFDFLNKFDEYFYDEFSGLSPIAATELIEDIASIVNKLKYRGSNIEYFFRLSDLFRALITELNKEQYKEHVVYDIKLNSEIKGKADDLLKEYYNIRKNPEKCIAKLDSLIIIVLKSMVNSNIYMSKFIVKSATKYALVIQNNILNSFIKNKKFIVLDATADLNKHDYAYLGITVDKNFSRNTFDYSKLQIQSNMVDNIKDYTIRNGNEKSLDKIIQLIPEADRKIHTFAPQRAIDPLISTFGFDNNRLFYFFSGEDIGSNRLRDITKLNILCTQTYPKILRVAYNHVLFGYTLEEANRNEHDMAEWYMLTRDLIQLIGRTAIRKHLDETVIVNLYQVESRYVQLMKEIHFKNCEIHTTNSKISSRSKSDILIDLITIRLRNSDREYVYIDDLLKEHFRNQTAIRAFFNRNKNTILKLTNSLGWTLIRIKGTPPHFKNTKFSKIDTAHRESYIGGNDQSNQIKETTNTENYSPVLHIRSQFDFNNAVSDLFARHPQYKTKDLCRLLGLSRYYLKRYITESPIKIQGQSVLRK